VCSSDLQAEFAFNYMVNRSTGISPFVAAYGHQPKQAVDVSDVPSNQPIVENMIDRAQEIYRLVEEALNQSNRKYKASTD